ncbi:MAG: hypothetical protein ACPG44_01505 [Polaribacter sp.]
MEVTVNKSNIVGLMREIREKLSLDLMNMSFEEQKEYLSTQIKLRKEKRATAHKVYTKN